LVVAGPGPAACVVVVTTFGNEMLVTEEVMAENLVPLSFVPRFCTIDFFWSPSLKPGPQQQLGICQLAL